MKKIKFLIACFLMGAMITSCGKEDIDDTTDDTGQELPGEEPKDDLSLEIKDFEWKAMNVWYLYKDDKDILQDNYFSTQAELNTWLSTWDSPEDLFYDGLLYNYPDTDRFSWIVDDYTELENLFAGVSKSTGMDYGLTRYCQSCSEVLVYVRYVVPNTPAAEAGIKRGMIFTEVDGQQIYDTNYSSLLSGETLTFGVGKIENGEIITTDETIKVNKVVVNENPVLIAKTIDVNGTNVGYLMYNSFTHDYDDELNAAFGEFKSKGITELVLDLRYNGGGRITSAVDLASMITGQFNNEIFTRAQYNSQITEIFNNQDPENLLLRFDDQIFEYDTDPEFQPEPINSLNLNRVYVIATGSTASSSELVINGLAPYIEVIHVGTKTVGKVQASRTMYDSSAPNFYKTAGVNSDHKYALQPLISTSVNANRNANPLGLVPDVEQKEYIDTFGVLGDPNEPLLAAALNQISADANRSMMLPSEFKGNLPVFMIGEKNENLPNYQRMYLDDIALPDVKLGADLN